MKYYLVTGGLSSVPEPSNNNYYSKASRVMTTRYDHQYLSEQLSRSVEISKRVTIFSSRGGGGLVETGDKVKIIE